MQKKFINGLMVNNDDVIYDQLINPMFCVTGGKTKAAESVHSLLIFLGKKEKLCEELQQRQ